MNQPPAHGNDDPSTEEQGRVPNTRAVFVTPEKKKVSQAKASQTVPTIFDNGEHPQFTRNFETFGHPSLAERMTAQPRSLSFQSVNEEHKGASVENTELHGSTMRSTQRSFRHGVPDARGGEKMMPHCPPRLHGQPSSANRMTAQPRSLNFPRVCEERMSASVKNNEQQESTVQSPFRHGVPDAHGDAELMLRRPPHIHVAFFQNSNKSAPSNDESSQSQRDPIIDNIFMDSIMYSEAAHCRESDHCSSASDVHESNSEGSATGCDTAGIVPATNSSFAHPDAEAFVPHLAAVVPSPSVPIKQEPAGCSNGEVVHNSMSPADLNVLSRMGNHPALWYMTPEERQVALGSLPTADPKVQNRVGLNCNLRQDAPIQEEAFHATKKLAVDPKKKVNTKETTHAANEMSATSHASRNNPRAADDNEEPKPDVAIQAVNEKTAKAINDLASLKDTGPPDNTQHSKPAAEPSHCHFPKDSPTKEATRASKATADPVPCISGMNLSTKEVIQPANEKPENLKLAVDPNIDRSRKISPVKKTIQAANEKSAKDAQHLEPAVDLVTGDRRKISLDVEGIQAANEKPTEANNGVGSRNNARTPECTHLSKPAARKILSIKGANQDANKKSAAGLNRTTRTRKDAANQDRQTRAEKRAAKKTPLQALQELIVFDISPDVSIPCAGKTHVAWLHHPVKENSTVFAVETSDIPAELELQCSTSPCYCVASVFGFDLEPGGCYTSTEFVSQTKARMELDIQAMTPEGVFLAVEQVIKTWEHQGYSKVQAIKLGLTKPRAKPIGCLYSPTNTTNLNHEKEGYVAVFVSEQKPFDVVIATMCDIAKHEGNPSNFTGPGPYHCAAWVCGFAPANANAHTAKTFTKAMQENWRAIATVQGPGGSVLEYAIMAVDITAVAYHGEGCHLAAFKSHRVCHTGSASTPCQDVVEVDAIKDDIADGKRKRSAIQKAQVSTKVQRRLRCTLRNSPSATRQEGPATVDLSEDVAKRKWSDSTDEFMHHVKGIMIGVDNAFQANGNVVNQMIYTQLSTIREFAIGFGVMGPTTAGLDTTALSQSNWTTMIAAVLEGEPNGFAFGLHSVLNFILQCHPKFLVSTPEGV